MRGSRPPEMYRTHWLTTLQEDGRPHTMPVLGLWLEGAFWFLTGETTRKGRGSPPYSVYRLAPTTVFGLPGVAGTNEKGEGPAGMVAPTRWRFEVR